ncbi:MAG: flavodoxin family protein [Promethearchaeota archaeon]
MKFLYISGSPRKNSNTDYLLNLVLSITGGKFIKLTNYDMKPCHSCRICIEKFKCVINDDMSKILIPELLESDGMAIRGKLKNKIGGTIVVGRRYGSESAITAINSFYLKHEMIVANRGVNGIAFNENEIIKDSESIEASKKLAYRLIELHELLKK